MDVRGVLWGYLVGLATACALAVDTFGIILKTVESARYVGDFTVFWSAAQAPVDQVYDWSFLRNSQMDRIGEVGPFAYPPTALLLLRPFGLFPIFSALTLWGAVGLAIYCAASRQMVSWRVIAFALLSPAVMAALVTGQTTLVVGGLMVAGVASRDARAIGLLFGLAAAIKPQAMLLAPVALAVTHDWKALAWMAATFLTLVLLTVAIWGLSPWQEWTAALREFAAVVRMMGIAEKAVTPPSLATFIGIPEETGLIGIPIGVALVLFVFRATEDRVTRLAALGCGTIMALPYALNYDLVAVEIAAACMLLDRKGQLLSWAAAALVFSTLFAAAGVILMAVAVINRARVTEGEEMKAAAPLS